MKLNFYDIIYILFLQYFFKKFGNIFVKINLINISLFIIYNFIRL